MVGIDDIGKTVVACSVLANRGRLEAVTEGGEAIVRVTAVDLGYGWEKESGLLRNFPVEQCTVKENTQSQWEELEL